MNTNLTNNFEIPQLGIAYNLHPDIKTSLDATIQTFRRDLNLKIAEFEYSLLTFTTIAALTIQLTNHPCFIACGKASYTNYFNDTTRFDIDSPYHSFDDLINNPKLLSNETLSYFEAINADTETTSPDRKCQQTCITYDRIKQQLVQTMLNAPDLPDYDAFIVPSWTILPFFHEEVYNISFEQLPYMVYLSAYPGFPSLNLPGSYSARTAESPDGLPIGMLLVAKPDRLLETLKIARLMEETLDLTKLPHNTPFLKPIKTNECKPVNSGHKGYSLITERNFYIIAIYFYIAQFL